MAALDQELADMAAEVEKVKGVEASAIAVINGIAAKVQAAYDQGLAAGATPAQLQGFADLRAGLDASATNLAAAVATQPA